MADRRHRRHVPVGPESDDAKTLAERHETFERLRRRHASLGRKVRLREAEAEDLRQRSCGKLTTATARDQVGYRAVWSRWSESYDEVAAAADDLLHSPPRSLADVCMMFSALEWVLLTDGVIVDRAAERQVRRFGRRLRQLAAGP